MLVGGDVFGKELEGNEAAQAGVFGLENNPDPAATESFDHPVMRDGLADHVRVAESLAASLGSTAGEVNEISGYSDSEPSRRKGASLCNRVTSFDYIIRRRLL